MRTGRRSFWLAAALLAFLLAQVAVVTHDAAAAQHSDDALCQLCLAGHSVGSAIAAEAPPGLPPVPAAPPSTTTAERAVRRAAPPWQARAPPNLP